MGSPFIRDYDLDSLEKLTSDALGFEFYTTSRLRRLYADQAAGDLTPLLVRQAAKGVQTFMDVGAHHGFFEVLVGSSNPDCRILAYEPIPENVEVIEKNLLLNGLTADVHRSAVSDVTGQRDFQVSEASDSSGFVANPAAAVMRSIKTEVVRLDQFIDCVRSGPVLVKIDAEGNELKVLEGMRRIIEEREDVRLVIEFNPRCLEANGGTPEALLDRIDTLGFEMHWVLDPERRYARLRRDQDWREHMIGRTSRNLYCVKKGLSLNLCVFSHTAEWGGAELSLLELIDCMTKRYGTVFTVMLPSNGPLRQRIEALGAATLQLDYRWWTEAPDSSRKEVDEAMVASCANVHAALPVLFDLGPDVVVTNTLVVPWGAVAAMRLRVPHIWWVKEFGEFNGWGFRFLYTHEGSLQIVREASNHVVVSSHVLKTTLFGGAGPEQCSVAMNRMTLKPHTDDAENYFRYRDSFKAVIVGNVSEAKGQGDAVRAVAKLLREGYDVELCVAGYEPAGSDYCRGLRAYVAEEGLGERIRFLGFLDDVRPLLEQAHIGLTCSRSEGFGRNTAEAMMLGKPVIGSSVGGTVELIEDEVTGLMYAPGDVAQLADRIAFFVENPEAAREFGERARVAIRDKLAVNPVDSHMFDLCLRYKGGHNPYSPRLTRLMLEWQRGNKRSSHAEGLPFESAGEQAIRRRIDRLPRRLRRKAGRLVKSLLRGQGR
ncbi:MAG: FkbM family methyltransferase [Thermoleophilia bacterium]|nr:FkbM family methyltransferase [Thermoleophilia bacterium]